MDWQGILTIIGIILFLVLCCGFMCGSMMSDSCNKRFCGLGLNGIHRESEERDARLPASSSETKQ